MRAAPGVTLPSPTPVDRAPFRGNRALWGNARLLLFRIGICVLAGGRVTPLSGCTGSEAPDCRVGGDCASGVCLADGTCAPVDGDAAPPADVLELQLDAAGCADNDG